MSNYQQLKVWQKSMDLAVEVYRITKLLPKEEVFGLSSQMRRAAVSVPSNIAEGAGRKSTKDYVHFLKIGYGSLNVLETQLLLGCRLNYVPAEEIQNAMNIAAEIGRMLNAMILRFSQEIN